MKKMITAVLMTISLSVLAGVGHFHPKKMLSCKSECTETEVKGVASASLMALADGKSISPSWTQIQIEKIEKKQFKKGPEWVLSFFDQSQPAEKQRLYVFITMDGWLNGSNYTGK